MGSQNEAQEAPENGGHVVRPMNREDVEAVREVARATWADAYEEMIPELERAVTVERAYAPKVLERRVQSGTFLVAEWRGEVVGFADFSSMPERSWEVYLAALYVLPGMQGRGIGSSLLEEGIRSFPAARSVVLRVLRENDAARRFYEARGFRPADEYPWQLWSGGVVYELEMVRDLGIHL